MLVKTHINDLLLDCVVGFKKKWSLMISRGPKRLYIALPQIWGTDLAGYTITLTSSPVRFMYFIYHMGAVQPQF